MKLENLKILMTVLKTDLYRCRCATGSKGFLKTYFRKPGFRFTFWFRRTRYLNDKKLFKVFYWIASRKRGRLAIKYGMSISHMTEIGPGLFIGHYRGIVINSNATIKECTP